MFELTVEGKFVFDPAFNPPPLKSIRRVAGVGYVDVGEGVTFRLGQHPAALDQLLDLRVEVDPGLFTGLGSIEGGCAIICASNRCAEWARRNGRPRAVAKVIGVASQLPVYVLVSQPRLREAPRARHETATNRRAAGLVPYALVEPIAIQCPQCSQRGTVHA